MQHPEKFRLFYNQTIQPELVRLDRVRRRLLRMIFFSLALGCGVLVVLYVLGIFFVALLAMIPFVFYIGFVLRKIQRFRQAFKPKVVRLVLDFIDDGLLFGELKYAAAGSVSAEKFLASQIFVTQPAVYNGEDFIEGRIGDVEFEMCELDVKEYSRVRSRLDQVFRGIFLRAKFFHPAKGALLVIPKTQFQYVSESVKTFVRSGGQPMESFVQHEKFRSEYLTYATRDARVNDLLPEELMNFILSYRKQKGEMYLSMREKNCYVAISNEKDILEPRLFQSNVSFELVREFYNDIYVALYVVMALDRSH